MKKLTLVLFLALMMILGACNSEESTTKTYSATLSGASEVPAVTTTATGSVTVTIDGSELTLNGTYTGLSAAASGAHIHGPAAAGSNAGVFLELSFTAATSGTLSGTKTLTAEELSNLEDGLYYVNVHTPPNASGEIRGQLELE
jgi:hypothetical protein